MPYTGPLEDRVAIRELLEAYSDAVCCNDPNAWVPRGPEDSVWELPDYPQFGTVKGSRADSRDVEGGDDHYPGIIFVATPGSIEVNGDTANVRSYTSEVYTDAAGVAKRDRGRYEDVVIKRGGKWLFQKRVFRNIHRA